MVARSTNGGSNRDGMEPEDLDATTMGTRAPLEHLQQRGLAGTVRSQQRDQLTLCDMKRHPIHGCELAVGASHVVSDDDLPHVCSY